MSGPGATPAMRCFRLDFTEFFRASWSRAAVFDAYQAWTPERVRYSGNSSPMNLHSLSHYGIAAAPSRRIGAYAGSLARLLSVLPLICIIALLAGCGTTALKPEEKLVSSVTTLPPVSIPIPVRCVDKVPPIPDIKIDPNATPLQRWYQTKEALIAAENFILDQHILLLGCAAKEPKP